MRKTNLGTAAILLIVTSVWTGAHQVSPQADIRVDRQTVFALHYGVGSITPAERADVVNRRLRDVLNVEPLHAPHLDPSRQASSSALREGCGSSPWADAGISVR
jgi:hypothetical protein